MSKKSYYDLVDILQKSLYVKVLGVLLDPRRAKRCRFCGWVAPPLIFKVPPSYKMHRTWYVSLLELADLTIIHSQALEQLIMELQPTLYRPLRIGSNEIRLLYFLPSDGLPNIHCNLETFVLENAPKYIPLSYELGKESPWEDSVPFFINSARYDHYTNNLALALVHFYYCHRNPKSRCISGWIRCVSTWRILRNRSPGPVDAADIQQGFFRLGIPQRWWLWSVH